MSDAFRAQDITAAFGLLTRLPVTVDPEEASSRAAQAVWAHPLVGAALGGSAALLAKLALLLGTPTGIAAALALAALVIATGALHEDGLADCADGLGGGKDKTSRLAIMKDSRIGAFGATALALALIARWSGLETLAEQNALFWPLVAVGAASRLPMVLAMFILPPARPDGLSASVGLPPPNALAAAGGIVFVAGFISLGFGVLPLLFWTLIAPIPLLLLARKLIDGQTGDILGGSQQLAEIAGLAVAAALILP